MNLSGMRILISLSFILCACAPLDNDTLSVVSPDKGQKIVSLDLCADQFVLKYAGANDEIYLSPDATKKFSYMRDHAKNHSWGRPRSEAILAIQPDLVVRAYGGTPRLLEFLQRTGISTFQLGFASSLSDVRAENERVSEFFDQPEKGKRAIAEIEERRSPVQPTKSRRVLYITAGGFTAGPGTLIDDIITAAGYENFQNEPGWQSLPLEALAYEKPDFIAASFFDNGDRFQNAWSASSHRLVKKMMAETPVVQLDSAWTACAGWFSFEAVNALAKAHD